MANVPGTNVPALGFGDAGFQAPSGPDVLAGVQADWNAAFQQKLSYKLTTPQGQLASSEAALIGNFNSLLVYYSNQMNPSFATGRMQDGIAQIYFLTRQPALPTVLQCPCVGAVDTVIPINSSIVDETGNTYVASAGGTIPASGTITLAFENLATGPIAIPGANQVSIYQAIGGWDTVSVASGVLGRDAESPAAFEQRRKDSVAGNSFGAAGSITGAIAKVANVADYFVYDNGTNGPVTVGGVSIAANSIYCCVSGGTDLDVAQAILSKKAPGCSYTGTTTVTAYDNNPLYSAPVPYAVKFTRPSSLPILFAVSIVNGPLVPADATAQIQNAIVAAAEGQDGGPRARINSTILATRYVTPIALLGPWALVSSLTVGSANTSGAVFAGSIAGTALTSGAVSSGTIAVGQYLTDAAGAIAPGTKITAGSGTSWTVNVSQTVGSTTMTGATANQTQVVAQANQEPLVEAPNVAVALV